MNTRHASLALGVAVFLSGGPPWAAAAPNISDAGTLAATCFTCHGTGGRSVGGIPPALAGEQEEALFSALQAFKAGKRPATVMTQIARGYTDEQLKRIAAFFAGEPAGPAIGAPATAALRPGD